jgi:hypothetical protein
MVMGCASEYNFYILYLFILGVVIEKMNGNQKSWTSQSIENARSAERCIGNFYVECVSRLFYGCTKLNFNYRICYNNRFYNKKKVEIELSSGDEDDDVIDVKPKLEPMEPCCSLSLKD